MKVAKLTIKNGTIVNTKLHHPGITQPWVTALCGQDLWGDNVAGECWEEAEEVEGKINCPDCLRIIRVCRKLQRSDFISD